MVSRRIELGMRTREALADKIEISYRVLSDLENGKRSFAPSTLAVVEQALDWQPGSAKRVVAGGEPTPTRQIVSAATTPATPISDEVLADTERGLAEIAIRLLRTLINHDDLPGLDDLAAKAQELHAQLVDELRRSRNEELAR